MESEVNELGEVYYWEYIPAELTSWDDANKQWDSPGATQPWDTFGNTGRWTILTNRTLTLSESTSSHGARFSRDYLSFIDAKLSNQGTVFNDFELSTDQLSSTDFKELSRNGTPIGYENIRPLYPGEYTYEKAIVGLRMRQFNKESTLGFYKAILNVDVEDTICRGTVLAADISTDISHPTRVDYPKWYYNTPEELMFTIMNFSEPCHVKVIDKTDKYFTFVLESDTTAGRYVTGDVNWLSVGY